MSQLVNDEDEFVLLTHAPPYGTELDFKPDHGHVGSKDYREFVEKHQNIKYLFCGHIHEGFEKKDTIGNCKTIDPGPEGEILEI